MKQDQLEPVNGPVDIQQTLELAVSNISLGNYEPSKFLRKLA